MTDQHAEDTNEREKPKGSMLPEGKKGLSVSEPSGYVGSAKAGSLKRSGTSNSWDEAEQSFGDTLPTRKTGSKANEKAPSGDTGTLPPDALPRSEEHAAGFGGAKVANAGTPIDHSSGSPAFGRERPGAITDEGSEPVRQGTGPAQVSAPGAHGAAKFDDPTSQADTPTPHRQGTTPGQANPTASSTSVPAEKQPSRLEPPRSESPQDIKSADTPRTSTDSHSLASPATAGSAAAPDAHLRPATQNPSGAVIPPLAILLDPDHSDRQETPEFVRHQREQLAAARDEYRKELSNQQSGKAKFNAPAQSQALSQSQAESRLRPPVNPNDRANEDTSAKNFGAIKASSPRTEQANTAKSVSPGAGPIEAGKHSPANIGNPEQGRIGLPGAKEGPLHGTKSGGVPESSLKSAEPKQPIGGKSQPLDNRQGNTPGRADSPGHIGPDNRHDSGGSDIAKGHHDGGKDPSSTTSKGQHGSGKELGVSIGTSGGDGTKAQGSASTGSTAPHPGGGKDQGGSDITKGLHDGKHPESVKGAETKVGDSSSSSKSTHMPGRTETADIGGHGHSASGGSKSQITRAPSHSEIDSLTDAKGHAHHADQHDVNRGGAGDGHKPPGVDTSRGRGPWFIPGVITDRDGNRTKKEDPSRKEVAPAAKTEPGKGIINSVANSVTNAIADGLSNIKDKFIVPVKPSSDQRSQPSDKHVDSGKSAPSNKVADLIPHSDKSTSIKAGDLITHSDKSTSGTPTDRIVPSEKTAPSDKSTPSDKAAPSNKTTVITPADKSIPSGKSGPPYSTIPSDKTVLPGRNPSDKTVASTNTLEPDKLDPRVEAAARLIKGQTYKPDTGVVINRNFGGDAQGTKTHLIYHGKGKLSDSDGTVAGARPSSGLKAALRQIFGDNRPPDNRFVSLPGFKTLKIDSSPTKILTQKPTSAAGPRTVAFAPRNKNGDTIRLRANASGRPSPPSNRSSTAPGKSSPISGGSGTSFGRHDGVSSESTADSNDHLVIKKGLISGDLETRRRVASESVYLRNQKSDKIETLSLREQLKQLKAIEDAAKRGRVESEALTIPTNEPPPTNQSTNELSDDEDQAHDQDHDHDSRYLYHVQAGDTLRSIFQEQLPHEAVNRRLFEFFIAMNEQTVRFNSLLSSDGMTLVLKPGTVLKLPTPRQIAKLGSS
jgi:hypothetical protein